ncbi:MAG: periplasmic heavy metal sensor [Bacteroidales bacterium]|nr:periplasmic heavy metal sensor [Bacteroidales bacterium]
MKTNKITTSILAIALIVGMSFSASAQRGQGMKGQAPRQGFNQNRPNASCAFLNLTEEQQTQMAALRLQLTEKNLPLKNQLGEMRAKMQTLKTGDDQNLKSISKLIDDMSGVQAQLRKNFEEHRLAVRALLTDDQQVLFDASQGNQGNRAKAVRGQRNANGVQGPRANGRGLRNANCPYTQTQNVQEN